MKRMPMVAKCKSRLGRCQVMHNASGPGNQSEDLGQRRIKIVGDVNSPSDRPHERSFPGRATIGLTSPTTRCPSSSTSTSPAARRSSSSCGSRWISCTLIVLIIPSIHQSAH